MALSPGIPTSFVPKQQVQAPKRRMGGGTNLFLIGSLVILGIAILAAGAAFAYDRYLTYVDNAKSAELAKAQADVNQDTVQEFVRLRNRFSAGKDLLNSHVILSQFFTVLESATLQNVRYSSLRLQIAGDRSATLDITGIAKNFNTLAVQSNAMAADPRFKRAIFSGITLNKDNTVNFHMTADIDANVILIKPADVPAASAPAVQNTPTTPAATTTVSLPQTPVATTTPKAPVSTTTPKTGTTTP